LGFVVSLGAVLDRDFHGCPAGCWGWRGAQPGQLSGRGPRIMGAWGGTIKLAGGHTKP
jgi:hypothetical protein